MRRLTLSLFAFLVTANAHAFSPICPEFTASPTSKLPKSLTAVLGTLAEAIKRRDADHFYDIAAKNIDFGDGLETRLGHLGLHDDWSPIWNELDNALYAGCASLSSSDDVWECPGLRDELFLGTGDEKYKNRKYVHALEMARAAGSGGPLLNEDFIGGAKNRFCERTEYIRHEFYAHYVIPPLDGIREAKEQGRRQKSFRRYYYDASKGVKTWFKYSHYRMRFKEIDGKWRMTALFRKY